MNSFNKTLSNSSPLVASPSAGTPLLVGPAFADAAGRMQTPFFEKRKTQWHEPAGSGGQALAGMARHSPSYSLHGIYRLPHPPYAL